MDELEKYLGWITDCIHITEYSPTGSYYICDPPVTDTDIDYVCLIPESSKDIIETWLVNQGYTSQSNLYEGTDFLSFRKERLNLIITWSDLCYEYWIEATARAKEQNLLNKDDRIKLFKAVKQEVYFGNYIYS